MNYTQIKELRDALVVASLAGILLLSFLILFSMHNANASKYILTRENTTNLHDAKKASETEIFIIKKGMNFHDAGKLTAKDIEELNN